jgi:TolB-like protein/class 3 adenylate cyclase/Tfp pilus assembly protein PilF
MTSPQDPGAETTEHRLVGILNADVVGYSRLMSQDEDDTVEMLTTLRRRVGEIVPRHHGRLVDFSGDNFLAQFPTALESVRCALAIREAVAEANATRLPERRMEFRMGVHLGDVRIDGDRIYGGGVNIAARLQSLAAPGGICVSGAVHEQVEDKLPIAFNDAGDHRVKNIPRPVRAYHLRLGEGPPARRLLRPLGARRRSWLWAVGITLALLGILTLARPLLVGLAFDWLGLSSASLAPALPDGPSLVVLPFENLSDDREQEYFSDAISEDLTTDLSRHPFLFVISRTSAFAYKDRPETVAEIGRELGVRYVLEGSVRKVADHVRINAQLIDAATDYHVWSGRWDRDYEDVLELQSELSEKILVALTGEIDRAEIQRLRRQPVRDLTALDLTLRARFGAYGSSQEDNAEARRLLERVLALDPTLPEANALLGATHYWEYARGWDVDASHLERAEELARRAIELDPGSAMGHLLLATTHFRSGRTAEAIAAAELAVEAAPSYELSYVVKAQGLAQSGRYVAAMRALRRAFRLSPRPGPDMLVLEGYLNYAMGRTEQAVELWERASAAGRDHTSARIPLAIYHANAGQEAEARRIVAELQRINPSLTAEQCLELIPAGRLLPEADRASYVALLREVGLP